MTFRLQHFTVLLCGALLCPLALSAEPPGREAVFDQLIDRAVPPETIADAIVDFVPRMYMPLNVASRTKRVIDGSIVKLERGPTQFLEREATRVPVIVHSANTLIAPLNPGEPVKLFLKRDPKTDEYYLIAVMPVTYAHGGKP